MSIGRYSLRPCRGGGQNMPRLCAGAAAQFEDQSRLPGASMISSAARRSSAPSARVSPYSGSTVMTSNSADPTSSYSHEAGSVFCAVCDQPRPPRRAANAVGESAKRRKQTCHFLHQPEARVHIADTRAGTSCGTWAASASRACAATRLSSRNAGRRRNRPNSPDRTDAPANPSNGANTSRVHSQPLPVICEGDAPPFDASTAIGSQR